MANINVNIILKCPSKLIKGNKTYMRKYTTKVPYIKFHKKLSQDLNNIHEV